MATVLNVETIATDADLVAEVGSQARLDRAQPDITKRTAARVAALQDVITALGTRNPPVFDTQLADPTELKKAVVYRALSKIFLSAVSADGDVHTVLHRSYDKEYQGAVRASFSLAPDRGQSGSGFSIRVERR